MPKGTALERRRDNPGHEALQGWGVKGITEGLGHTGEVHKGRGLWGQKQQVQSRAILLPEDKVRTVNLPPTAAVL